jgi:hypothetical protein
MRNLKLASGLVVGCLLLAWGMVGGCEPYEHCGEVKTCGSKTLFSCTADYVGCRFKSSDGHSWSCTGTDPSDGYAWSCSGTSCETAAQEASDWCFAQSR